MCFINLIATILVVRIVRYELIITYNKNYVLQNLDYILYFKLLMKGSSFFFHSLVIILVVIRFIEVCETETFSL